MVKLAIVFLCLLFTLNSYCQNTTNPYEFYKQKSKRQFTAGTILCGTGLVMTGVGIVSISGNCNSCNSDQEDLFDSLFFTGIVALIASVPVFISASANKRKAAELSFAYKIVYIPKNGSHALHRYTVPSLSITICFP